MLVEMDVDVSRGTCWYRWLWMLVGTHVGRDGCGC